MAEQPPTRPPSRSAPWRVEGHHDEADAYAAAGFDRPPRIADERRQAERPVPVAREGPREP